MSIHVHSPGTPEPDACDYFLVDDCPRCTEHVEAFGVALDPDRYRAFWRKMVDVEYEGRGGYGSALDKDLGRRLYLLALGFQRAFGIDPRIIAVLGERAFVGVPIATMPSGIEYEVCPDCLAVAWGNATCATCRSHWPDGDPMADFPTAPDPGTV